MCVCTCGLISTIVDFLSDCVQGDRFLDDVIIVGDLRTQPSVSQKPETPGWVRVPVNTGAFTCVLDTSFINGQLSGCLTSSTISCSQVDSSWMPWLLPEDRRLQEAEGATGLDALGGGAAPGRGFQLHD